MTWEFAVRAVSIKDEMNMMKCGDQGAPSIALFVHPA
jgi:hypothetical protein